MKALGEIDLQLSRLGMRNRFWGRPEVRELQHILARDEVITTLTQKRKVSLDENSENSKTFDFRGGCTLILDLQSLKLKYVIKKLIDDSDGRLSAQRDYRKGEIGSSLRATYFGDDENQKVAEPFALLHSDL